MKVVEKINEELLFVEKLWSEPLPRVLHDFLHEVSWEASRLRNNPPRNARTLWKWAVLGRTKALKAVLCFWPLEHSWVRRAAAFLLPVALVNQWRWKIADFIWLYSIKIRNLAKFRQWITRRFSEEQDNLPLEEWDDSLIEEEEDNPSPQEVFVESGLATYPGHGFGWWP